MKLYGSLNNRLNENKQFVKEIKVGDGCTKFYYTDREAYEVVKVENQKHIWIRKYDHKAVGPHFSNDWELVSNTNNYTEELVYRYKHWHIVNRYNKEWLNSIGGTVKVKEAYYFYWCGITDEELKKIKNGEEVIKYQKLNCGISFGIAQYYYDYSF